MAASGVDPRGEAGSGVRPSVARPSTGLPNWVFIAGIALAGLILFLVLDSRRRQLAAPSTRVRYADTAGMPTSPEPLYVPPLPPPAPIPMIRDVPRPSPAPITKAPAPQPSPSYTPPVSAPSTPSPAPSRARQTNSPLVVMDVAGSGGVRGGQEASPGNPGGDASSVPGTTERVRASIMANRSTTVPQGTLIPAVLESALDSTRAGPARALVTRDVRGFDGSKILIPRGSKLIGEYKADLQAGQNRALVIWTRLVRPDGATIALASPSADPLGRVGIKGQVNTHFLERFASALLQSTLNVGTSLAATRIAGNNSIAVLAIPGALNSGVTSPLIESTQVQRTLRVKQGASVSVFVTRDLDFTGVETR